MAGAGVRPSIVAWRDAFDATDMWTTDEYPADSPVIVTSVGFIMHGHLDGYVVVASSTFIRDGRRYFGGVQYIPEGMIIELIDGGK